MRTTGWREFVLSLVVLSGFAANGWARPQEPPDDDTAGPHHPRGERGEERRSRAGRSHRPPPVAAQGVGRRLVHLPPERDPGRQEARKQEEREGPDVGQHRSRGSRLRAERQLHRPRTRQRPRAHRAAAPHESRRRLRADVRRRPVAHQQLAVERDDVGGADRRPPRRRRGRWRGRNPNTPTWASAIPTTRSWWAADGEVEERRRQLGPDDRAGARSRCAT
jgi:hypothetical protein